MLKKLIAKITGRNKREAPVQLEPSGQDDKPLPHSTDTFAVAESSSETKAFSCGHIGPKWFVLDTYGIRTKRFEDSKRCPRCHLERLRTFTIRCAACGHIILPGDGVALYDTELNKMKYASVAHRIDERTVLGCMRWDCCESGAFFGGNWSEQGFVPQFNGSNVAQEAFRTGRPIIVENIPG